MSMDESDYEYEDDDQEYIYEDDDGIDVEEEEDSGKRDDKSESKQVESKESGKEDTSAKRKSFTPQKNSLLRQTSNSLELVVPYDSYVIRNASEIKPLFDALVGEVAGLLGITDDEAQALLQSHKWSKERLTDAYFSNAEKIRQDVGLTNFTPEIITRLTGEKGSTSSSDDPFVCRVCYDECNVNNAVFLGCLHKFCRDCFSKYTVTQINDGPACILARCPEFKCKELITKSVVKSLVPPEDVEKYDSYYLRNFIEMSKSMKYCPAPRCDRVAVGSGVTSVRCDCGYPFCFKCGEEAHDPCSCAQLAEWSEKCSNESETANWILANTRKCPECQTRIEKNHGCNHMTCKVCKHEFCWICMGSWAEHGTSTGGFYKCNRFDPSNVNASVSAAQKAKAELDRYLHYYQRFHGHNHALKFASAQREQAEKKMIAQQENQKSSWVDVQFVKQATEQLIDCRRVLKYTYVLGYFLKDSTAEKRLFEHHQEMLEKNTEKLHEYTEKPVETLDRTEVVNLARVTDKFMQSLLQNMAGGIVRLDDDTNIQISTSEK